MSEESSATQSEMDGLHDEVAKKLREVIKEGETVQKAGKEVKVPVSAAMLGVAVRFLKDNNITCDVGVPTRGVNTLKDSMGELHLIESEEEDIPVFKN
jgi:hypothetical protein